MIYFSTKYQEHLKELNKVIAKTKIISTLGTKYNLDYNTKDDILFIRQNILTEDLISLKLIFKKNY